MKKITVRKNGCHRAGIWMISLVFLFITIVLLFCTHSSWLIVSVSCTPWLLVLVALVFYYETWTISFCSNEIRQKCLFIETKHTYSQIKDVTISYSYTDHAYVSIFFVDGSTLRFRMKDKNAESALAKIRSHHSIRIAR